MDRNASASIVERGSAPDWIIVGLGAIVAVIAVVVAEIPTAFGVIVGLVVVATGIWDMNAPSVAAVGGEAAGGLLTFLLPWIGSFASFGIAWAIWALGVLVVVAAAWSWASHPTN